LFSAWIRFTGLAGMSGASVGTDCADCQICFTADDGSFHLRQDPDWWVVDRINDRGKRYDGTAKFSTLDLAEKYLIWRWVSSTRIVSGAKPFGPELYSSGYSKDVSLKPTDDKWRTEVQSPVGSAVLFEPDSTIFSHLMSKSIDEIQQMIGVELFN
jgi:hypothetical protein